MRSFPQELWTRRGRQLTRPFSLPSCKFSSYCSIYIILTLRSLRASKIDSDARLQKLLAFVDPVKQLWQNTEMDHALASFGGFSDLLGLSKVRDYLVSRRVHEIDQWGMYQLDSEGQAIQKELEDRLKVRTIATLRISFTNCYPGFTFADN